MEAPARFSIDLLQPHVVYKNAAGTRLPGVTTILSVINKPALVAWANAEGLAGRDTSKTVQRAADIGTVTHARIEAYVRGMELDESELPRDVVDRSQNGALRFMDFWQKAGYELSECELAMVSESWQVGGTLDILARNRDGGLDLLDVKTSKRIYPEHRIQACAYAAIYEEAHGQPISGVWIARVGKEVQDDIEVLPLGNRAACVDAFTCALNLYRALNRVGR